MAPKANIPARKVTEVALLTADADVFFAFPLIFLLTLNPSIFFCHHKSHPHHQLRHLRLFPSQNVLAKEACYAIRTTKEERQDVIKKDQ
jgi:hypothetical protein